MEKERAFKKAGFLIHGLAADAEGRQRRHVVMPYTEGRFGANTKYYAMLKGSIDPGETPLQTAIREAGEESGIDIPTLLGASYEDFLEGKLIENAPSGYPGVTIKHASREALVDHTYVSGHGAHNRTLYFGVEVEGIEHLRPFLKRMSPDEEEALTHVKTTSVELSQRRHLPNIHEMLNILRTGIVPAGDKQWNGPEPQQILPAPKFAALEREWTKGRPHRQIRTVKDWKNFCRSIPGAGYRPLEQDFEVIKKYFESRGVIGDYGNKMKLDTKDIPLQFYQEAAELHPIEEVISRIASAAKKNPFYAKVAWGEYEGPRREPVDDEGKMKRAQIAPLMEAFAKIAPMEITAAAMRGLGHFESRIMRAVDAYVNPAVKSAEWTSRVLSGERQAREI